jgi:hypothetical protein
VSHRLLGGAADVPNTQIVSYNGKRGSLQAWLDHPFAHPVCSRVPTVPCPRSAYTLTAAVLQRFVPESLDMSDLGPAGIAVDEVHKVCVVSLCACTPRRAAAAQFCIARAGLAQPHARGRGGEQVGALDILLFNTDRHEGNLLLARRGGRACGRGLGGPVGKLVPIDHGLCLPEVSPHAGRNRVSLRSHARCVAIPNRTRNKFLGTGRKRCHVDPSCAGHSQSPANADCISRARREL